MSKLYHTHDAIVPLGGYLRHRATGEVGVLVSIAGERVCVSVVPSGAVDYWPIPAVEPAPRRRLGFYMTHRRAWVLLALSFGLGLLAGVLL